MRKLSLVIDRLSICLAVLSGILLCGVVVITFYDVVRRYLFSAPLFGRQDIIEMSMILVVMLAMPYTWRLGGHISVDVYETLPNHAFEILRKLFLKLAVASVLALMAFRSAGAVEEAILFGETTNLIRLPHLPFIWAILLISTLHTLIILAEIIESLFGSASSQSREL